jgi:polysaccharide biosynthesis transport protein
MTDSDELSTESVPDRPKVSRFAQRYHRLKFLTVHYWWIIAITVVIGLGVQGYRCFKQVPHYMSVARMMVNGQLNLNQGAIYSEDLSNFYGTQVALMKSGNTLVQAMARVRTLHPEIVVDERPWVDAVQEPRTAIFDLQVVSDNAAYAPLLLNAIMDNYLASKRDRKEETTNEAVSAITAEISHLDSEIRDDEQQLLDFQKENNVVFIEEQSSSAASYLVGLNNEMARLTKEHDLLALEDKDRFQTEPKKENAGTSDIAQDGSGSTSESNPDINTSIIKEQEDIEKLKIARDDYSQYLKDQHPKMIALTEEIDKSERFLDMLRGKSVEERSEHIQDLELQIENLGKQIVEWNKKSLDLNQRLGTFQQLKSKIAREQTMYNQLAASFQNVNLNKSMGQEDVVAMEEASRAFLVPSNYPLQLLYGIIGGLIVGSAIIYFINRLDDRIDSPFFLEEMVQFPVIGQIPFERPDRRTKRLALISSMDKRHVLAESLRNIRSSILFRSNSVQPRSILVCSSIPNEGKSTLAANLAITFAFAGARTLLVDADLRRGILHGLFDAPASPGLSDYLRQRISWRETVQKTSIEGLDLIPRGKIPHQAGELLLSSMVELLLHESTAEYDTVLWDSAPLMAADDTTNLCSKLDGILFVARVGLSSVHAVRTSLDMLAQRNARVIGLVINAVEARQPGYYDRYKYKEYYAVEAED